MPVSKVVQATEPLIEVKHLVKHFPGKKKLFAPPAVVKAVNDLSFTIGKGTTYGLVGESGCGKSTTGRMLLRLIEPTSGEVFYQGKDILKLNRLELRQLRKDMQIVFQDPFSALNPRIRVGEAIREVLDIHSIGEPNTRREQVYELFHRVGLNREQYDRYPHEFSGGQRQRIVLARALAVDPGFIVCDEAVSALDVSTQSQVINLLEDLQQDLSLTYLFIAHNLSVVRHIADKIGVMYLGNLVEEANTDDLFSEPLHPYTQALLSAIPRTDLNSKRERIVLSGDVPSPLNLPAGCVFHTRCPAAREQCRQEAPPQKNVPAGRRVACHLY
ncbi:ABC transporter ATP-binding protein [Sporomusa termitida]|uniref:Oligopeptide transport ATP-binding protein OppF n=1 Tax=Sporomusa termitida TaxID=2377 RepID=A0A517DR06_9FIRM|nr:dipeptide ABC transporter ATP-binding protein [Sporomusa termitida]QDR79802.1 Oligopeptide transport ATP-binding protein OppF [Sporomusa termitida]